MFTIRRDTSMISHMFCYWELNLLSTRTTVLWNQLLYCYLTNPAKHIMKRYDIFFSSHPHCFHLRNFYCIQSANRGIIFFTYFKSLLTFLVNIYQGLSWPRHFTCIFLMPLIFITIHEVNSIIIAILPK